MLGSVQPCYDAFVAFSRWDPLPDLLALNERIGQLAGVDATGWTPPVDLYETVDEYVLTAEVPGLSRHAIEIEAEESRITIRGERPPVQLSCEQFHRIERGHGRFARTFTLPDTADVASVRADLKDGVLTVVIPKATQRGVRRIVVS